MGTDCSSLVGVHQADAAWLSKLVPVPCSRSDEKLQPGALETLQQVAMVLSLENQSIEVEGHTDDVPIKTAKFPSNWELSSARASSVSECLSCTGVGETPRSGGDAANQPVEANDTPEHRAKIAGYRLLFYRLNLTF